MPTIEERLVTYTHELDAAADRADAARTTSAGSGAALRDRSRMRGWQSVSIAAVTIALLGAGLWAINDREGTQTTTPATVPFNDTALPGEASPWYRITAARPRRTTGGARDVLRDVRRSRTTDGRVVAGRGRPAGRAARTHRLLGGRGFGRNQPS